MKYVICDFKLQILHNNDMHSRFDEINKYGDPCSRKQIKENKCYGGFARMKQAAKDAAKSALKQNISTVFINAGDTFQGTSYYSVFKRKIVAPLIDSLQLDVMVNPFAKSIIIIDSIV